MNWHCEDELSELVSSWSADPRFELILVDNSGALDSDPPGTEVLRPARNLGFGGAINAALDLARAPLVLILNPDAHPTAGALESLIEGFERFPDAAGLAPKLVSADGTGQHRWQLRPLPRISTLLLQALLIPAGKGSAEEPIAGTAIQQPAAAALALRRSALDEVGGFDETFYPAWFEDVDLARRFRDLGRTILYWPSSTFEHQLGTTVSRLGYGRFIWIYYQNLSRYIEKHHSGFLAVLARLLLTLAAIARLPLLALRKPRRATSRSAAAFGLAALIVGSLSGWRLPRTFQEELGATNSTASTAD